jgi:beta-N-acetylhexosaminidase
MSPARAIALGPVILDVAGIELTADDRKRLVHPMVGGVIFCAQLRIAGTLAQLARHSRAAPAPLLRSRSGRRPRGAPRRFTHCRRCASWVQSGTAIPHRQAARAKRGYVLATELRAHGVVWGFTPVLDVDHGNSSVIGDRAFHSSPNAITELALGLIHGLALGGMSSVGKHFPGHGHVTADSHREIPVDARPYAAIEASDLQPFRRLIENGLGGIMPAHVVYPDVDTKPAGFSEIWLKQILRQRLG